MVHRCLVAAVLCALCLSCSDGDDDESGTLGSGASVTDHEACVDRINAYRASIGLPPYARDASSEACADAQARSDSQTDNAHGAFGDCGEFAQNECPGWDSIEEVLDGCLQNMWDEGPGGGHYENMAGDYEEAFCGFYTTPDGEVWAIQNFR